jgi:hypothetical protein
MPSRLVNSTVLIIAILFSSTAAYGQVCPASDFGNLDAAKATIAQVAKQFDAVVNRVEGVPPSDASYIETEIRASLDQRNRERYNIVSKHRFFAAHQVRSAHKEMANNFAAAAREARYAEIAVLLSASLSKFSDLNEAFDSYFENDNNRPNPILPRDARREVSFDLTIGKGRLLRSLQCVIRALKEP